ncbi:MAG: TonB-dependent receptor [Flavobacteriales bacterium]|nr:TonB-dependent receptor [Flavobacteriales bacterium]
MNLKSLITGVILLSPFCYISAQTSTIKGRVFNSINNEAVPFANIYIDSTSVGTTSDIEGNYRITDLKPGTYSLTCSFIGFKTQISSEVNVSSARITTLDFALVEESTNLNQVVITASPFNKREESPVSLRTISSSEIYRNPGGNRDISNVIQILPGVASSSSFRNDIIVRGGAPNENRFYLDGIEVPNINHFATQGSSGGPVGMINVNFIREVDFYAGAFPANRGNALSSILEFRQIEGNDESLKGTFMLGSSDVGMTLDGPIGKKSTFILSARRSYLQFLFKALGLPFLPTYNDFQYKQTIKVDKKNRITLIGLGAIDDFQLNTSANDDIVDEDAIRRNNYILGNLPVNTQWNYTVGANWKHFSSNSFQNLVVSRNHLNNRAVKYQGNIEQQEFLLLDYNSQEIENKVRLENTIRKNGWKLNMGVGYENATYTNSTFNKIVVDGEVIDIDFDSSLPLNKFAVFSQVSKELVKNKLLVSLGVRMDCNDYSEEMNNPLDQLSPRLSASYSMTEKLKANFNVGRYFQLPPYTIMGYRDNNDLLANKENNITYIQADHYIAGLEYNPSLLSKVTLEGFYKTYDNYPFLIRDSLSLANLGGDFGVIGNEPVNSTSFGRTYGVELLVQQKLLASIYGILSYTFVRGEFSDKNDELIASSWDNRHILNITAGKKFKNDWEVGMKFRYVGGAPYTPYDVDRSATIDVWDVVQQGVFDWDQLNELRNPASHGLDIRVDKKWYFNEWAINAYIDVQNIYNFQAVGQPYLDVDRDDSGNPIIDPNNPQSYVISEIENVSGTVLPSIGLMIDF